MYLYLETSNNNMSSSREMILRYKFYTLYLLLFISYFLPFYFTFYCLHYTYTITLFMLLYCSYVNGTCYVVNM